MATKGDTSRKPGRPPRISLDDIVAAATALGLDGLTMGAVAERLGVTGSAIYYYVGNVEELSALVCDRVALSYPLPDPAGRPWGEWVVDAAWNQRRMLESMPGMAAHAMRFPSQSPGILDLVERCLVAARASGFDPVEAMWVTRSVANYVEQWVARREAVAKVTQVVGHSPGEGLRQTALAGRYPHLEEFLRQGDPTPGEDQFAYTLSLIISGATARLLNY
jgi:AcrR family transcriptional regulator